MSTKTFTERTRDLDDLVGTGTLTGRLVVDQVYARYQHEGLDLKHPEGGQAKYLEQPFYTEHSDYMRTLADQLLRDGPAAAMIDNMEDLVRQVYEHAPIEFGDLKASGHPIVEDGSSTVYDRLPNMHRLSKEELRIKSHLRSIGL